MNDINKQIQIIKEIKNNKIHIMGISETKLNYNNAKFLYKNETEYQAWFSKEKTNTMGSGVALIIHNNIAKHVQKVEMIGNRIIYADMYFKGKIKLRVIQVYVNASINNKSKREEPVNNTKEISNYNNDRF